MSLLVVVFCLLIEIHVLSLNNTYLQCVSPKSALSESSFHDYKGQLVHRGGYLLSYYISAGILGAGSQIAF